MNKKKTLFEELGFSKVDHARTKVKGWPEVIYCPGKTPAQITAISKSLLKKGSNVIATRANRKAYQALKNASPQAKYDKEARIAFIQKMRLPRKGRVLVLSAGSSDQSVAKEAVRTAELLGCNVESTQDVGIAGIHRLLSKMDQLREADVVIVVAGMDGALASAVAGLTPKPVVAVPTSVGYGASFKGLAALLTMLNACAPGVAVVNIDNGFGAGYFAASIIRGKT
ncbi:nickel pincer cofactor biosynthesis protein LarB [Candidatus Micrarchaeota archaeon]|nr:nickel pincer cofactor biosynthesis protein LarB [Candidatus Micrarchaeota archaeon]